MGFFKFLFKKKPAQTLGNRVKESGNVFMMLFGAVAMVGVIGASTMTVMKGPVRTMSQVTKRTIAENNMIAAGKLALIASSSNDCDSDDIAEPLSFVTAVGGITGGGTLPAAIGVAKQDPWGNEYGYCVWDHGDGDAATPNAGDGDDDDGSCGGDTNYRAGTNGSSEYVLAIVSSGPDRMFNTTCDDYTAPGTPILNKASGSDDIILGYTLAEASAIAGGLWSDDGAGGAEIATNISVDDGSGNALNFNAALGDFAISGTGSGKFPTTNTDNLQAYGGAGGTITVDSALSSSENITTTGNISGANLTASGTLGVTGATTLAGLSAGTTTLGAATVSSLDAGSGTIVTTGTLGAGTSTLGTTSVSSLSSGGSIIANGTGNIVLKSNYLTGDGTGDDGITIDAAGNVTGSGDIGATGALTSATLATTGNATIGSTLSVTGATTLGVLSAGATTLSGDLAMGTNAITGLADPTNPQDAATRKFVLDNVAAGTGYTESDPQVGDITTAGKWCTTDGSIIDCTSDLPGETDPQVGTLTAGRWCTTDGTDIDCTSNAPSSDDIIDADSDTLIQVEEGADDDTIRFDTFGTERMVINSTGNVGIGTATPNASSLLELASTTKGFLAPRMTSTQRDAISAPTTGLQIYNTTAANLECYSGSSWESCVTSLASGPASCSISGGDLSEVGTFTSADLNGANSMVVLGNYAYVTSHISDSLTIIDISNPASPTQVGTVTSVDLNGVRGLTIVGNYAYVAASYSDALTIIDISNPASPTQVGTVTSVDLDFATRVAVDGNYAYVASRDADSLTVIDISTPSAPVQVGTVTSVDLDNPVGIAISGNYVYVTSANVDAVTVIDVSTPALPTQVETFTSVDLDGAGMVSIVGNLAYVAASYADALTIIDISNPLSLSQVGTISGVDLNGARGVAISGKYAYVASYFDNFITTIDISTPSAPVQVDTYDVPSFAGNGAWNVEVYNDHVYFATPNVDMFTVVNTTCDPADTIGGDQDTLADLVCTDGQIISWDNGASEWVCTNPTSGADNLGNHTATTDIVMGTNKITGLGAPTAVADATTKAYVDGLTGANETDPQVGTLTAGKWCTTNGTDIDCTSNAPGGGANAINDLTDGITGGRSVFLGTNSGVNDDGINNDNTAVGYNALSAVTSGVRNVAVGSGALANITIASDNVAIGKDALNSNTASGIIAIGRDALKLNDTGSQNVAIGNRALDVNIIGGSNTAVGFDVLGSNIASNNSAFGRAALGVNTTGAQNAAFGRYSMSSNDSGSNNVAFGDSALRFLISGNTNVAIGNGAGRYRAGGSAPADYNTTGNNSVFLGADTRVNDNAETNQIVIGYNAIGNGSNSVTLGNTNITKTVLRGAVLMENDGVCAASEKGAIRLNATADGLEMCDGAGTWSAYSSGGAGDNLGDHTATQDIDVATNDIINIDNTIFNGIAGNAPISVGDDNLGNHTATTALDMATTNKIINLADPTLAQDAATKAYVDAQVGGLSSDTIIDADSDTKIQVEEGADDDTIRFDTFGAERMVIDSSGNVGIGPTVPNFNLHVSGTSVPTIKIDATSAATDPQLFLDGQAGRTRRVGFQTNGAYRWSIAASSAAESGANAGSDFSIYRFNDAGVFTGAPLSISRASGDVSISNDLDMTSGTITNLLDPSNAQDAATKAYVDANGDNLGSGGTTTGTLYTTNGNVGRDAGDRLTFVNNTSIDFDVNTVQEMSLTTTGLTVTDNVTATAYFHSSDERLKKNIKTISGLELVSKLRGVTYEWKKDGSPSAGVIAQEVEKVLPRAVKTDEKGMKSVDYDQLIGPLIEAVKELKAENEALSARIKQLEENK